MQFHGFDSLDLECNILCLKFLISLHFHPLLVNILATTPLTLVFFVWMLLHSVRRHVHFLLPDFFVSGGITTSPLQTTPFSIVNLYFISLYCLSALEQFLLFIILDIMLLSTGSCVVSVAIQSYQFLPNGKSYPQKSLLPYFL